MQGIEATFDDLSFEDGDTPQRVLPKIVPGAAALALAGAVGVWALHWVSPTIPEALFSRWAPASTVAPVVSKAFADIAIDDNLLAQLKAAAPAAPSQQVASLEAAPSVSSAPFPLPRLEPFPPAPAIPPAASVPLPPGRDVPEIGETESFPLPPVRPSGFGAPTESTTPERHAWRPNVAVAPPAAPTDNRNVFEKLFGWAHSSLPVVASTTQARTAAQPVVAQQRERESPFGLGRGPLFSFPSPFGNSAPTSGYDRYTAVYDISARVVYLPDGTRLEAHSGLGAALDNPRYVAERAVGPTPPHVYELTLREGSFHGVQAIRLNPVGEGGILRARRIARPPLHAGPQRRLQRLRVLQGLQRLPASL